MITLDYSIFDHLMANVLHIAEKGKFRSSNSENKFVLTGFPSASYNYVMLKDANDGLLDSIIAENIPFVCFAHQTLENAAEVFAKYGMPLLENVRAHELNNLTSFAYEPNEEVEIRRVTTEEDLVALDDISHVCFHDRQGFANKFLESMLGSDNYEMFLAYVDGKPVGTGALSLVNNEAGLYWLGVLPEYRKVGVGSELVKFRANRAKEKGFERIFSQNFEASKSMYRKLGFKPGVDLPLYVYAPKP